MMPVPTVRFTVHVKTANESNARDTAWRGRHARSRKARKAVADELARFAGTKVESPAVVRMTRISAGTLDDDGLRSALKSVRDAVATWLGVDDADERVRYVYGQERGPRGTHCVSIEMFGGYRVKEVWVAGCH